MGKEEVFGPVMNIVRCKTLSEAIEFCNNNPWGNGSSIMTKNGHSARNINTRLRPARLASTCPSQYHFPCSPSLETKEACGEQLTSTVRVLWPSTLSGRLSLPAGRR